MPKRSFLRVFERFEPGLRSRCNALLHPQAQTLTALFYEELMRDEEARAFLENDLVHNRLSSSFTNWCWQVFDVNGAENADALDHLHLQVGAVHSRIGIPMHLISYGMQSVRDHALELILDNTENGQQNAAVSYVNCMLDTCLAIMNRAYMDRTVTEERNAQLMRFKMAHSDLALECERMRTELIIWSRDILLGQMSLSEDTPVNPPSIYNSTFGLWITHKADFYFPDYEDLKNIRGIVVKIDALINDRSEGSRGARSMPHENQIRLRELVDRAGWFINQIIEKSQNEYQSTDSLTRLINRRFMDNVLRREVEACRARNETFGILMIDIDDFKRVNDNYGHLFGDLVLQEIASTIHEAVRVTDFCFRYGGEEILVVIPNASQDTCEMRAESIRCAIENNVLRTEQGQEVRITVSIGVALYDGHPDFQRVIDAADKNLYAAKQDGKNQVVT